MLKDEDHDTEMVLNRARLYHDRRDFYIQYGDTGMREDYPDRPGGCSKTTPTTPRSNNHDHHPTANYPQTIRRPHRRRRSETIQTPGMVRQPASSPAKGIPPRSGWARLPPLPAKKARPTLTWKPKPPPTSCVATSASISARTSRNGLKPAPATSSSCRPTPPHRGKPLRRRAGGHPLPRPRQPRRQPVIDPRPVLVNNHPRLAAGAANLGGRATAIHQTNLRRNVKWQTSR